VLPPSNDMSAGQVSSCLSIVYTKNNNETLYGAYTVTKVAQLFDAGMKEQRILHTQLHEGVGVRVRKWSEGMRSRLGCLFASSPSGFTYG
jgi:hypothetical protein